MPQIQYSEKYYDETYEYRCVAARRRGLAGRVCCSAAKRAAAPEPQLLQPLATRLRRARARAARAWAWRGGRPRPRRPARAGALCRAWAVVSYPLLRAATSCCRRTSPSCCPRTGCCRRCAPHRARAETEAARRARAAPTAQRATRCLTHSRAQAEWRGMGVQQSRGWVHYAIHRPEPHIMLYRCVASRERGALIAAPSF